MSGIPADLQARIRALGPVLDVAATQEMYGPLLAAQPRADIEVLRDLAYGADERHRLDLYRRHTEGSPQPAAPKPVLLIFHGGGFIRGDKRMRENAGLFFAREGFLALVPNYRLAPAHSWPAGALDVAAAVDWARSQAPAFGGDPNCIWLFGESAGAAHVATACLLRRFHPAGGLNIAGAALVSGVYNAELERRARRQFGIATPDPRNEAYFGRDFDRYPSMSVVDLIDSPPFPLLITYAELDMPQMQVQAGELFARLVTRHDFAPELAVIPGHNHLSQVYAVNTGDRTLTDRALQFFRSTAA